VNALLPCVCIVRHYEASSTRRG